MMRVMQTVRLAAGDLVEESLVLFTAALIGGFLSLLVLPLPFVLAANYGVAERIPKQVVVGLRIWLQCGREHALFFYKWMLLVFLVTVPLIVSIFSYSRIDAEWAPLLRYIVTGFLLLWWLPQPFVPALYLRQEDRRLRVALRNAWVLALIELPATILLWGTLLLSTQTLGYLTWPLLLIWVPVFTTRVVWLRLKSSEAS